MGTGKSPALLYTATLSCLKALNIAPGLVDARARRVARVAHRCEVAFHGGRGHDQQLVDNVVGEQVGGVSSSAEHSRRSSSSAMTTARHMSQGSPAKGRIRVMRVMVADW